MATKTPQKPLVDKQEKSTKNLATKQISQDKQQKKEKETEKNKNKVENKQELDKIEQKPKDIAVVKKEPAEMTTSEKPEEFEKHNKKGLSTLSLFLIFFVAFLLIIVISFFIFTFSLKGNSNIFSGIYIKNIDVSNLNVQDAKNKIDSYIKSNLPEEIVLKHGDYETTITTSELKIDFDTKSATKVAYNFGRSGNIIADGFEVLGTMVVNKNVEPTLKFDEEALINSLNDISSKLPDKVIESGYYVDGNSLVLNKGSVGTVIDVDKMADIIKNKITNLNLNDKIEIVTKTAKPTVLDLKSIYNEIHIDAVDASFTLEPRSVTPSKNGMDFEISYEEAKAKFDESEGECVIPLKVVYPNVTTNMLSNEAFPDELSSFSTYYDARNYNRTTNLRLAAEKINGTVLLPGETFSYNQVVGERTIAAGYKEAPIYVSGRVEDGLGGGICQITTTLYNAVVYANLEIVERTNHQFVPSYVGAGRDATVVYGALDFKFKNNRDYPIKIVCSVSGGIAYFQILGLRTAEDYDVEIYARITSQTANNTNSETYKILRKDGAVVEEKLLSRDTYKRH